MNDAYFGAWNAIPRCGSTLLLPYIAKLFGIFPQTLLQERSSKTKQLHDCYGNRNLYQTGKPLKMKVAVLPARIIEDFLDRLPRKPLASCALLWFSTIVTRTSPVYGAFGIQRFHPAGPYRE